MNEKFSSLRERCRNPMIICWRSLALSGPGERTPHVLDRITVEYYGAHGPSAGGERQCT